MSTEHPAINREDYQLLKKLLSRYESDKILSVGIGNTLKGDDGAGPIICQKLKENSKFDVIDAGTVPENYIQPIIKKKPQLLIIIDAIDFNDSAGTIKVIKPDELSSIVISTHCLSPRLFVDIIYQSITPEIYFIGIQPKQTQLDQALSKEVEQAVDMIVKLYCF